MVLGCSNTADTATTAIVLLAFYLKPVYDITST